MEQVRRDPACGDSMRGDGAGMSETLSLVGPALLLAGGTTVVGFGTLMWSAYGPLRSLGFVSVATIASALIASLLVLPALVITPERGAS